MAGNDLLDVVDEDDRVVARATSDEVHARGLLHRFVAVVVVGSDGRILLQQRASTKARGPLLFDSSVGGHCDAGEGYWAAAVRESREELGLDLGELFPVPVGRVEDRTGRVENMLGQAWVVRTDGPFSNWEAEADRLVRMWPEEFCGLLDAAPFLFTDAMQSVRAAIMPQIARLRDAGLPAPDGPVSAPFPTIEKAAQVT